MNFQKEQVLMLMLVIISVFFALEESNAEVKEYNLEIDHKTVNYSGKEKHAMSVNNSIPGPTLYFKEGDIARINVKNKLMLTLQFIGTDYCSLTDKTAFLILQLHP